MKPKPPTTSTKVGSDDLEPRVKCGASSRSVLSGVLNGELLRGELSKGDEGLVEVLEGG